MNAVCENTNARRQPGESTNLITANHSNTTAAQRHRLLAALRLGEGDSMSPLAKLIVAFSCHNYSALTLHDFNMLVRYRYIKAETAARLVREVANGTHTHR